MRSETIAADSGATAARPSAPAAQAAPVWPGLALAIGGSVAFAGKAIIVKLAYRYDVDAVTLIAYRMLFALPMFALLAWWSGRGPSSAHAARLAGRHGPRLQRLLPRQLPRFRRARLHHRQPGTADPLLEPDSGAGDRHGRLQAQGNGPATDGAGGELLRRAAGVRPRTLVPGQRRGTRRCVGLRQHRELFHLPRVERRGGQAPRRPAPHRPGHQHRLPVLHRPVPGAAPALGARRGAAGDLAHGCSTPPSAPSHPCSW